jgi:Family of unknown function (DUF6220)
MQKLFLASSTLLVADVLAQFYFAGVGAFHLPADHEAFSLHAANALVLQVLAVLTAIAAALARAGKGTIALAFLPALLKEVQYAIFALTEGVPRNAEGIPLIVEGAANYFIALHVLNALTILAVSVVVFRRARRIAARKDVEPVAVGP